MSNGRDDADIKVVLNKKIGEQDTAKYELKLCEFSSRWNRRNQ